MTPAHRSCLHCILPPYVLDRLVESPDPAIRRLAVAAVADAAATRAVRTRLESVAGLLPRASPERKKHRLVYDAKSGDASMLPGKLQRTEGQAKSGDPAVDEAYEHSGTTYDFFLKLFGRNSLDGNGMSLVSSVHYLDQHNNAFWTGEQMCYGDGDGKLFKRFTRSLDVVGHELTHGIIAHTAKLVYAREPGALNEHFADVFGVLVRQWKRRESVKTADWHIGAELIGRGIKARGIRVLSSGKAYEDDPHLGTDPQPKYLKDIYLGSSDRGGVHLNSGIPNHAFYLASVHLGGNAWERMGQVWYKTLLKLTATSNFNNMVESTTETAATLYGAGSKPARALDSAWKAVGF